MPWDALPGSQPLGNVSSSSNSDISSFYILSPPLPFPSFGASCRDSPRQLPYLRAVWYSPRIHSLFVAA